MDTSTNLYDYVMAQLRAKQIPQRRIASESGVPFSTVCKIAQGSVTDPSVHTVQRLANYFKSKVAHDHDRRDHNRRDGDRRHGEADA